MFMKKFITLLCITLLSTIANAQDTIRIKHTNYSTVFSKSLEYPVLVEWWETKEKINCQTPLKRKDNFQPDPQLKNETNLINDYVNSGYDRGHLCPAADNQCQTQLIQNECFYFSNMVPQPHSLNAGKWKSLETLTRELTIKDDSIHVWAGAVGSLKRFGPHNVSVPTKCWKVIYIVKTKEYKAYIFKNTADNIPSLDDVKVNVSDVEKLTGFKFN